MTTWDPEQYLTFADERGRPFGELLARVGAREPRTVVDLGCGPGTLTGLLADRWPDAEITGLDSSPEMIGRARAAGDDRVTFDLGDVATWAPGTTYDVVVSNATLQWVPDHLDLLPRLIEAVTPGGWLAFGVPANFDEPSHVVRRELADEEPYAAHTRDLPAPASHDARVYLDALGALGCEVDAWETTYLHVLTGEDPVLAWISGTSARPTLQALPDPLRAQFEAELGRRLREAYPDAGHGAVLPFRRVFVVARTPTQEELS